MDEGYDTWIANLTAGRQSDADQAARAKFRAMTAAQAPKAGPARNLRPSAASVTVAGPNTWAEYTPAGDDNTLTTLTLLDGPGRWANCVSR